MRRRVQTLALFMLVGFGFDLAVFLAAWIGEMLGYHVPAATARMSPREWVNAGAAALSVGLWWAARSDSVSETRLHSFGLAYQIVICFVIAMLTNWQYFLDHGILPNLTWVPVVVILFPLILPGSPRRMMTAAIAAGAMSPLALLLLEWLGKINAPAESYVQASVGSALAIGFAYLGARTVYGLGREVAMAREMGSYILEEKLGQGGMGEVWKARHRMLARPAAVKLIRPSTREEAAPGSGEDAIGRFEREAQATARLRSPHTVELFDFGVAADGTFYYVMELLDGLDADRLVRRFGPVPFERAIHLLGQVCHSLSEAEARGLVHRDVKPANIFVCRYGEDHDFVKVLDFGLVKALGDTANSAETAAALTRDHVINGTPAFIAPEQAMGLDGVDGRADIYATGCVAYWLLTGQNVFPGTSSMGHVLHHAQTIPDAPSTKTNLHVPEALDGLVLSCLAKAPADRPQSARELAQRLAGIHMLNPWTEVRARDWWESHEPLPAP